MTATHRARAAAAVAWIICAAAALRFVASGVLPAVRLLYGDFSVAVPSSRLAWLRPDFPPPSIPIPDVWQYGPLLHIVTLPLFLLPSWAAARWAWTAFNLAVLALTFVLAVRLVPRWRELSTVQWVILAIVWLAFQPLAICLAQGNIEMLELLLMVAGLTLIGRSREGAAGVVLGIATMMKFLPVGIVAWLTMRRRWRFTATALITIAAIAAITAVTLDWRKSLVMTRVGGYAARAEVFTMHDMSITSAFLHLTSAVDWSAPGIRFFPEPRHMAAARAGWIATVAMALGFGVWLLWRSRRPIALGEVGALFILMFMLPAWNHEDYFIFALLPLTHLVAAGLLARDGAMLALTGIGYGMISPPIPFQILERSGLFAHRAAYMINYYNVPFWGAMILLIAVTSWADGRGTATLEGRG